MILAVPFDNRNIISINIDINFVHAVPSTWNVSASFPQSLPDEGLFVHPLRWFGCYPEDRVSDSSFPPGVGGCPF